MSTASSKFLASFQSRCDAGRWRLRAISSSANGELDPRFPLKQRTVFFDRSVDVPILDHAVDQAQLGLNVMRIMRECPNIGFSLHLWLAQLAITPGQQIADLCLKISAKTGCRLKWNKELTSFAKIKSIYIIVCIE